MVEVSYIDFSGSGASRSETSGGYSYQTGTNKLIHIAATPIFDYGYDPNGNVTSENTRTFVYDLSNQLIQLWDGSTQAAAYTYNGAGQRIKKVTQTETRIFHYDKMGHLIVETNQSGQMLAEYVYLGDQLLSMIKPGELAYYFHNDHLGTPQILTNDSQATVWKAVYTPFGEAVASIQTIDNPFRFPGQYYDQETGLHYNYFRYYNPQTGRYITPDPIGLWGGINLFAYVAGNPLRWVDPFGLYRIFVIEQGGRKGKTYGAIIVVIGDDGTTGIVGGSSWPDPTSANPGVAPGAYQTTYSSTAHHGKDPAVLFNGRIPTLDINPNNSLQPNATDIQMHCGYKSRNRGSEGCQTIDPDDCWIVWETLKNGQTGAVTVIRDGMLLPFIEDPTLFQVFLRIKF